MSKASYDPNKIDKIRSEIENPEGNTVSKLESIYHIASALDFDGATGLKEILDKEIYKGYGIEAVPPYRMIPMEIQGRNFKYSFPDPLAKYSRYKAIDIQVATNISIDAESVIAHITDGLEQTQEMKSFFSFLFREGTRKSEEERPSELKPNRRERIDFTGIGIEPIKIDGVDSGEQ